MFFQKKLLFVTPFLCLVFSCAFSSQSIPKDTLGYVQDCQPCMISVGQNIPPFSFYFETKLIGKNEKSIEKIHIRTAGSTETIQELQVSDMEAVLNEDNFFFEAEDINFDDFLDIYLITAMGSANAYADYWIFNPDKNIFKYLGNFPIFTTDAPSEELKTYERLGFGGMEFKKSTYHFVDEELVKTEAEEQFFDEPTGVFLKVKKTLNNGIMKKISEEKINP